MRRFQIVDTIIEVVEICHEIIGDIRQQVDYFNASVYKEEIGAGLREKVDTLRVLCSLLGEPAIVDLFQDYDRDAIHAAPSECSFSVRVARLLVGVESELKRVDNKFLHFSDETEYDPSIIENVKKNRQRLLVSFSPGSRCWNLVQALV